MKPYKNTGNPDLLPDIILLDINMPIMDGFLFMEEYIKLKHEINKDIAIYLVTSSIDQGKRIKNNCI
jgi:CheY-like chemotaxis protein